MVGLAKCSSRASDQVCRSKRMFAARRRSIAALSTLTSAMSETRKNPSPPGPEGASRADDHTGVVDHVLRPLRGVESRGPRAPHEHRRARRLRRPSERAKPARDCVAAFAIAIDEGRLEFGRVIERIRRARLNGRRGTVAEVRSHGVERVDEVRAADGEADPRSGHVEGLRKRVELDGHVLRARHLQDARGDRPVERQLAVGEVRDEQHPVFATERDGLLVQVQRRHRAGGIMRVVEHENPRFAEHVGRDGAQIGKEPAWSARSGKKCVWPPIRPLVRPWTG